MSAEDAVIAADAAQLAILGDLCEDPAFRVALAHFSSEVLGLVGEFITDQKPTLQQHLASPDLGEMAIALIVGSVIGYGAQHQDDDARKVAVRRMIGAAAFGASMSSSFAARLALRRLN